MKTPVSIFSRQSPLRSLFGAFPVLSILTLSVTSARSAVVYSGAQNHFNGGINIDGRGGNEMILTRGIEIFRGSWTVPGWPEHYTGGPRGGITPYFGPPIGTPPTLFGSRPTVTLTAGPSLDFLGQGSDIVWAEARSIVGAESSFSDASILTDSKLGGVPPMNTPRYLGFRFSVDDLKYYGWAALAFERGPSRSVRVSEWAYENSGAPIRIGQTVPEPGAPAMLLLAGAAVMWRRGRR